MAPQTFSDPDIHAESGYNTPRVRTEMEKDAVLIQQTEALAGGEFAHIAANLTSAYAFSVEEFNAHQNEQFREIALQCERKLRILRTNLLLRKLDFASASQHEMRDHK